jgi:hypothetical protein
MKDLLPYPLLIGMGGDGCILHRYTFSGSGFVAKCNKTRVFCYRKVVCIPKAYHNGWLLSGEEARSVKKLLRKWLFVTLCNKIRKRPGRKPENRVSHYSRT